MEQVVGPAIKQRLHVPFLDGIRALAALFVFLSHIFTIALYTNGTFGPEISPLLARSAILLTYAHYAVAVFIVLSGFLLMLPVAGSPNHELSGGFWGFLQRRARRILPPYYAALALFLPLMILAHAAKSHLGLAAHAEEYQANASVGSILTHVLMVHNLTPWNGAIDGPMWSVAAEWQIYIIFALLLLPTWRRFGPLATLALGVLLGYGMVWFPVQPIAAALNGTCAWYITLFTLGMLGATVAFPKTGNAAMRAFRDRVPWALLAGGMWGAAVITLQLCPRDTQFLWVSYFDVWIGTGTVCLILSGVRASEGGKTPFGAACPAWFLQFLQSRPITKLAAFSYSLYLLHYPILDRLSTLLKSRGVGSMKVLLILYVVGVPLLLGLSYLFYRLFEKPFLSRRK